MKLLAIALLAATTGPSWPTCQPESILTPQQTALGHEYDQDIDNRTPLTVNSDHGIRIIDWVSKDGNHDEAETRLRRLKSYYCGAPITIAGRIVKRKFLLSPERRAIWTEYTVEIRNVIRQQSGASEAALAEGVLITVVKQGGVICTSAGTFHHSAIFYSEGDPVMLFLTPKYGMYIATETWDISSIVTPEYGNAGVGGICEQH